MPEALIVLAGALAGDLLLGEPPPRLHPVVWMGRLQTSLRRLAPAAPAAAFGFGLLMALAGPLVFGLGAWWLLSVLALGLAPLRIAAGIYLLKSSFAVRGLARAALEVEGALKRDDLQATRHALRSLVSRDTSQLRPDQMAGAAIESVAENASDSVVAPLFYFAIAGIPGALAYRAINTLDAMIGYRGGNTEWLGKAAARLDDLANLIPARITALLLAMASRAGGGSAGRAMAVWMRDRRETESPNAGRPMAAMAGALGVELVKAGAYRLGAGLRSPEAGDIRRAVRIFAVMTGLAFTLVAALGLLAS